MVSTSVGAEEARSLKAYRILFVVVCAANCLPLWLTKYVPLVDYPNHLARCYVIYHHNDVASFRSAYDVVIEPLPNLAMDLVIPPLLRFFDINVAGKLFLTSTILLFAVGCHLIVRVVQGGPGWLALPCVFLSYNSMLFYGFLNYLFGLGLFLITFSLWMERRKNWRWQNLTALCCLFFLTYLAHLSAYVFLGTSLLLITLFDCASAKRLDRNMLLGLLPLLPPMIAFRFFMTGSGDTGQIEWNGVYQKLINSVSWVVTYNYKIDGVFALTLLLIAVVLLLYSKRLRAKWMMLSVAVAFVVLFVASPEVLFTSHSADIRFLPPAAVLAVASLQFEVPKRMGVAALTVLLVVSFIRLGCVWFDWAKFDQKIEIQVSLFDKLEEGSKVYPVVALPSGIKERKLEKPLTHIVHYSTIYRHTYSPTLFALRGQQPLHFKELFSYYPFGLNVTTPPEPDKVDWKLIFSNYDYIWCYGVSDSYVAYLRERSTLIAKSGDGMIFRINRNGGSDQTHLP